MGPKQLAIDIKQLIGEFLKKELHLELSPEKTLITNTRREKIEFLGVLFYVPKPTNFTIMRMIKGRMAKSRINNVKIRFEMPMKKIISKLLEQGFLKRSPNRPNKLITNAITKWIFLDHEKILMRYNAVINGFYNYYSFVYNLPQMHSLINYILHHSCAKTLARKFNLISRAAVFKKFGRLLTANLGNQKYSLKT